MEYINRAVEKHIENYLKPNKVVIILGARRVGKTALVKKLLSQIQENYLFLNGEDLDTQNVLERRSQKNYELLLGKTKLLVIDEAQAIPDIGAKLKLMVDSIDGLKILVTGSSVFDLNNKIGEPLVGRKTTFYLFPLSQEEFSQSENYIDTKGLLEERMIYGTYPELQHLASREEKTSYLKEQISSYLLKDILAFEGIQKREKIVSLLKILAFRVGSEISVEGIGNELQISKNTVDRYLDLLSKVFIIHQVSGFNRNLDNEITKKHKWYFYDNGILNALISNFNSFSSRDDQGKLWENYLVSERKKFQEYNRLNVNNYFWRTHNKQEIDWIEESEGNLFAYEFKWNPNKKVKVPSAWENAYPKAVFKTIHPDNYLEFIV